MSPTIRGANCEETNAYRWMGVDFSRRRAAVAHCREWPRHSRAIEQRVTASRLTPILFCFALLRPGSGSSSLSVKNVRLAVLRASD